MLSAATDSRLSGIAQRGPTPDFSPFWARAFKFTVGYHMSRWTQKLVVVLATGYILFFYSERVFWSFLRPGDKWTDLVLGWLVYSLLAWVFLLVIRQCRVAGFPALFLAGAIFGWLAEGVVVDTLYGNATNGLQQRLAVRRQIPAPPPCVGAWQSGTTARQSHNTDPFGSGTETRLQLSKQADLGPSPVSQPSSAIL